MLYCNRNEFCDTGYYGIGYFRKEEIYVYCLFVALFDTLPNDLRFTKKATLFVDIDEILVISTRAAGDEEERNIFVRQ